MIFIPTTVALLVFCISSVFGQLEDRIEKICLIDGERYDEGETVGRLLDGCNDCFCSYYGFGCTEMGCPWYEPLDCKIKGQNYKNYDVILSDVCGRCYCMNGNLACHNCTA